MVLHRAARRHLRSAPRAAPQQRCALRLRQRRAAKEAAPAPPAGAGGGAAAQRQRRHDRLKALLVQKIRGMQLRNGVGQLREAEARFVEKQRAWHTVLHRTVPVRDASPATRPSAAREQRRAPPAAADGGDDGPPPP
eukprot:gene49073-49695_t